MSHLIQPGLPSSSSSFYNQSQPFNSSTTSSSIKTNPDQNTDGQIIYELCNRVNDLEQQAQTFKRQLNKEQSFYKSITKLSHTTFYILLLLPFFQLILIAVLIYLF
ncbi:MAG: hypothetical protein IJC70_01740, partial [Firmicutes bacterium]|nr:hypothetical protein [Bacillota bacterium]